MKKWQGNLERNHAHKGYPNIPPTTLLSSFLNMSHVTYTCYNDNVPERRQATHV